MWCAARHCAFESHPLRQVNPKVEFCVKQNLLLDFSFFINIIGYQLPVIWFYNVQHHLRIGGHVL